MADAAAPSRLALQIIHFNDVYNISPRTVEPVGGAARFVSLVRRISATATAQGIPSVVFFSGDCISPSLLSTIMHGEHMLPILTAAGVRAAVLGNHELDLGVPTFKKAMLGGRSPFPWLVSNARWAPPPHDVFAGCEEFAVVDVAPGLRIGVLGLIDKEWGEALPTVNAADVAVENCADCCARLVPLLRGTHGCNLIVALTHMRLPEDVRLAARALQLDLILGGHDHSEVCAWGDGGASVPIVKSGSDFSEVTAILLEEGGGGCSGEAPSSAISRLRSTHAVAAAEAAAALVPGLALPAIQPLGSCDVGPRNGRSLHFDAFRYFVVGAEPEDAQTAAFVQQCEAQAAKGGDNMQRILGVSRVALDCRFSAIRTAETNVGNMVADLARQAVGAEVALINAGALRADRVLRAGLLRMQDLVDLMPLPDAIVKLEMPGRVLLAALNNAVSAWPKLDGRFVQVSGIRFAFDASVPVGSRVTATDVLVLRRLRASDAVAPTPVAAAAATFAGLTPLVGTEADPDVAYSKAAASCAAGPWPAALEGLDGLKELLYVAETPAPPRAPYATATRAASPSVSESAHDGTGAGAGHSSEPSANDHFRTRSGHHHGGGALVRAASSPMLEALRGAAISELPDTPLTPAVDAAAAAAPTAAGGLHIRRPSTIQPAIPADGSPPHAPPGFAWLPLNVASSYTVATRGFTARGKDGFDCLLDPAVKTLVDAELGPSQHSIVINHFKALDALADVAADEAESNSSSSAPGDGSSPGDHTRTLERVRLTRKGLLRTRRLRPDLSKVARILLPGPPLAEIPLPAASTAAAADEAVTARAPAAASAAGGAASVAGVSQPQGRRRRFVFAVAPSIDGRIRRSMGHADATHAA